MIITAICCTYRRHALLERMLECWIRQDYPKDKCELVILDDAGEYRPQRGENWEVVSVRRRFTSLGEKRNASAALARPDTDAFVLMDDDDIYLPWYVSATAAALQHGEWSRPSQVLYHRDGQLHRHLTGGLYHGCWGFTKALFRRFHGYGYESGPEDKQLMLRLEAAGVLSVDPLDSGNMPFYVYSQDMQTPHISWMLDGKDQGERVYDFLGQLAAAAIRQPADEPQTLRPHWDVDYGAMPILPTVHPRPF